MNYIFIYLNILHLKGTSLQFSGSGYSPSSTICDFLVQNNQTDQCMEEEQNENLNYELEEKLNDDGW